MVEPINTTGISGVQKIKTLYTYLGSLQWTANLVVGRLAAVAVGCHSIAGRKVDIGVIERTSAVAGPYHWIGLQQAACWGLVHTQTVAAERYTCLKGGKFMHTNWTTCKYSHIQLRDYDVGSIGFRERFESKPTEYNSRVVWAYVSQRFNVTSTWVQLRAIVKGYWQSAALAWKRADDSIKHTWHLRYFRFICNQSLWHTRQVSHRQQKLCTEVEFASGKAMHQWHSQTAGTIQVWSIVHFRIAILPAFRLSAYVIT